MVDVITIIAVVVSIASSTASLAYWLGRKFAEVESRFSHVDLRFSQVEDKFNSIEERFNNVEGRINGIENRINKIENRINEIESRINGVEGRIGSIEARIERLENAFTQFSEVLITALETKGISTWTEAPTLRDMVKTLLPVPRTKYYTWEVYERLRQLLDKDPNEYTMVDIEQMNEIADLIEKEGFETKRRDLIEYAWKLGITQWLLRWSSYTQN
ncbi:hypothetical protein [Vulcanisaeta sp. JCM 16159]|uniref:hypothetical protein n=1 Tax=Vulcanisaeta sp. JCM 16159 TaxID=1295371 RepID=UPI0006D28A7E|nr:hypothetical protein [Vulcanisaeta sp. JCM 16159]